MITRISISPLLVVLSFNMGCADEPQKAAECGGNGEMHGDHCHCDSGFSLSADGSTCEPSEESDDIDYGGDFFFDPTELNASTGTESNSQIWLLEAIEGDVHLKIEIYESYGGISSPGELVLEEVDTDYGTCGTCLLIETGCAVHGDHYHCERTFMPVAGGEVHIDQIGSSIGDAFAGELLGVVFQEVNIGPNYQTQAVVDGE